MNPNDAAAMITTMIVLASTIVSIVWIRSRPRGQVENKDLAAIAERLARMEQAIDAMAVETERISEGQRFTTKLLSERAKDALPRS